MFLFNYYLDFKQDTNNPLVNHFLFNSDLLVNAILYMSVNSNDGTEKLVLQTAILELITSICQVTFELSKRIQRMVHKVANAKRSQF